MKIAWKNNILKNGIIYQNIYKLLFERKRYNNKNRNFDAEIMDSINLNKNIIKRKLANLICYAFDKLYYFCAKPNFSFIYHPFYHKIKVIFFLNFLRLLKM